MKPEEILSKIPNQLRDPLVNEFNKILRNYRESRWEPTELDAGRFSEIIYSIIEGYTSGSFASKPSKPNNMVEACRRFEDLRSAVFPRSIRIQIPRMLISLYEIRNNRGVGHVGGDVDSNQMDAEIVVAMSKWLMAELVRIYHNVSTEDATKAVDLIVKRTIPVVWSVGSKKRVLRNDLTTESKILLILYSEQSMEIRMLCDCIEYANYPRFKSVILAKLHKTRLIEVNFKENKVSISPLGLKRVEENYSLSLD